MTDKKENIIVEDVQDIVQSKYLDYAMAVILDRSLPDSRDGMKPVHKRILHSMNVLNVRPNTPYKKSARIVGDVLGKYHPHGDFAVYNTIVRMSQSFSMRLPLIDGQGNFGSIDGDEAAAMRYTEVRLSQAGYDVFKDMPFGTVDFVDNFDGSEKEPTVLPFRYPNLIINGSQGIAVGMATNIPPHNPNEAIQCVIKLVSDRINGVKTKTNDLVSIMPAPDFPTGGLIHGASNMGLAFETGKTTMRLRAKYQIEYDEDIEKNVIVVYEIPYGVNKNQLLIKIKELGEIINDPKSINYGKSKVDGIYALRDESNKEGIRLIIVVEDGYDPDILFNQLAKQSQLETTVQYNSTVIHDNKPVIMGLTELLNIFIDFRFEVINRRLNYLLNQNKEKLHLFEALIKAINPNHLDDVIALIRQAKNAREAKDSLIELLDIDEVQATHILDLRLQKLTGMELESINEEHNKYSESVRFIEETLSDENNIYKIIIQESEEEVESFKKFKGKVGLFQSAELPLFSRLSEYQGDIIDNDLSNLTKRENSTISITGLGYVRRIPMNDIEEQTRGTMGRKKMKLRKGDFLKQSINCHSHSDLMFITNIGKVHTVKAFEISTNEGNVHINNIIDGLQENEEVVTMISTDLSDSSKCLLIMTEKAIVKLTEMDQYEKSVRKGGLFGITLDDGDKVIYASECNKDEDEIIMANDKNMIIRFSLDSFKVVNRRGKGVSCMKLDDDSKIIGGSIINNNNGYLICITETGMIKITDINGYNLQKRGGKGTVGFKTNERSGNLLAAIFTETIDLDVVTNTKLGVTNRIYIGDRKVTNRRTTGVNFIKIDEKDTLTSVFITDKMEDSEELEDVNLRVDIGEEEILSEEELIELYG